MKLRLPPAIKTEPWISLLQIWQEELASIQLMALHVSDFSAVNASSFASLAHESDLQPTELTGLAPQQARTLLKTALLRQCYAGTPWAMREAFKLCGYGDIKILEWFQSTPPKTPYTFQVEVRFYDRGPLSEDWDKALALIMRTKNMRSHLSALRVAVVVQHATPRLATATLSGETITVYPYQESTIRTEPARLSTRAAAHSAEIILIQPPAGAPL